jgi:hypothetical protein
MEQADAQQIASGGRCQEGLGLVRPPKGLFGSIYLNDQPTPAGRFRRAGYLPSGTVVVVSSPSSHAPRVDRNYCAFGYRGAISGYLRRTHILPLSAIIAAVGLNQAEIEGFISPADPERPLELFKTQQLSPDEVEAKLGRGDNAIILQRSNRAPTDDEATALEVEYISDPSSPNLRRAYVRIEDNRCCSAEGTYRIFRPSISRPAAVSSTSEAGSTWLDRLVNWASAAFKEQAGKIKEVIVQKIHEVQALAGCGAKATVKLNLELKAGLSLGSFGISSAGAGEVEWEKPKDKAHQFTQFGQGDNLKLRVAGVATCFGDDIAYLESAHIIADDANGNIRHFIVNRDEFFTVISERETLCVSKIRFG